ncbi:MAG: SH3 domain-containing protein, partial [Hominenteromicrobium sp.]
MRALHRTGQPGRRRRLAALAAALCLFCAENAPSASAAETARHILYSGPTEYSAAAASFSDGDTVTVLDRINESWARIMLKDGTVGYCDGSLLGCSQSVCTEKLSAAKTQSPVPVRLEADPDSAVIGRLAANVCVKLLSDTEENGYRKVSVHGTATGYLPSARLTMLEPETATVRTVPKLTANGAETEEEASRKLRALAEYFEDGRYWNYIGTGLPWGEGTAFSVTDVPCMHSGCGYNYCNVYNGSVIGYFPEYGIGMQCLGYASLISDLVFGTDAPVTVHSDFDRVRVGD